jgi:hypothetical protein
MGRGVLLLVLRRAHKARPVPGGVRRRLQDVEGHCRAALARGPDVVGRAREADDIAWV